MARVVLFNDPTNTSRGAFGDLDIVSIVEDGVALGTRVDAQIGTKFLVVEVPGVLVETLRELLDQDLVDEILGVQLDDLGSPVVVTRPRMRQIRKWDVDPARVPGLNNFRRRGTATVTEQQVRDWIRLRSETKDVTRSL